MTARAMAEHALCPLSDIADGGSAGFTVGKTMVMVIRRGDDAFVYVNSCPHIGSPLDFTPGRFLDAAGKYILCSTHGALFRIDDGFCVSGPCAGGRLTRIKAAVRDGVIIVAPD